MSTRRRGHNEGTIIERPDGRWESRLSLGDGTRKSFYGKTRASVARRLTEALRDLDKGLLIVRDERQTLGVYLDSWLNAITPTLDARTVESHRQHVALHITPTLGALRVTKVTPQHIQDLYARKLADGLATTTVRHIHATLHKALAAAARLGIVQQNVSDLVDAPRMRKVEMQTLTRDESQRFQDALRGRHWEPLLVTALLTGMRQGELLALRWRDVNLDAGRLSVRFSLQRKPTTGDWVIKAPKTARSRRQIALARQVIETLRRHQADQERLRARVGTVWQDMDLVFCTSVGTPLLAPNVHRAFINELRRAGLPRIRFHDLRHTCATLLFMLRVNPKMVSEMLGHASVLITLDLYSHVLPDMQQDMATALSDLFTE